MGEYQLAFHSMPEIGLAHRYDTDRYHIAHAATPRRMELTYILQGGSNILYPEDGTDAISVPCDSVIFSIYDRPVVFFADGYHQHATVEIWADYAYAATGGLLLPHVLSFGMAENPVRFLLEQLVVQHTMDPASSLNISLLWELLGKLSALYLADRQEAHFHGQAAYVKKAQQYVLEHLSAPIRVTDIAECLGISAGYLSHLFTEIQGQTVVEYINTMRIRRVEELVLTYGLDIREASVQVGLTDPNYTSRLFRKIRGCTLSELRHTRKKDSLLPVKP